MNASEAEAPVREDLDMATQRVTASKTLWWHKHVRQNPNYGSGTDKSSHKCMHCDYKFTGNASRVTAHLLGDTTACRIVCSGCTEADRREARSHRKRAPKDAKTSSALSGFGSQGST